MRRVLVTGASGFIGRAVVVELAERGYAVTALHHSRPFPAGSPRVSRLTADLRDPEALRRELQGAGPFDGVCHLAALTRIRDSLADPAGYRRTNVTGTANLLAALGGQQASGYRLVLASTAAVYGSAAGAIDEQAPTEPLNPYAAGKLAAERLVAQRTAAGELTAVVLRCFNVAGPGDDDRSRLLPAALAVAAGQLDAFSVNGDGSARRDLTHVADVARGYRQALETSLPVGLLVCNLGTGIGVSVNDLLATVQQVTGRPIPVLQLPTRPEAAVLVADPTLARTRLHWRPERSELEGIVRDAWSAMTGTADGEVLGDRA